MKFSSIGTSSPSRFLTRSTWWFQFLFPLVTRRFIVTLFTVALFSSYLVHTTDTISSRRTLQAVTDLAPVKREKSHMLASSFRVGLLRGMAAMIFARSEAMQARFAGLGLNPGGLSEFLKSRSACCRSSLG